MMILGITGGAATGKSAVTQMFADLGAPTISADALAHRLLAPGMETTAVVLAAFPECALPDESVPAIDRRALGRRVFADPAARLRLEALTHPPIIAALQTQIDAWRREMGLAAAAEIPLLFEAKLQGMVDRIVVVACDESVQRKRLTVRLHGDENAANQVMAAQWPLEQKIACADLVINTDGSLAETRRQVECLWKELA